MESSESPELHGSGAYWRLAARRLARSGPGLTGLGMIASLATVAVFAPFLASSMPIALRSDHAILEDHSGREVLGPGLSFPLLAALEKHDLLLLVAFGAIVAGGILCGAMRGPGRSGRLAAALGGLAAAAVVVAGLIIGLYESRRNLLLRVDFHAVEESLEGGDEWSIWPPVRYGPTYLDRRVDTWLRPLWLGFEAADEENARRLSGEGWEARARSHVLGTDDRRRDVLSLIIHGTRISLSAGIVAVSVYVAIGLIVGALAGYYGGWVDVVVMRVIEIISCFPSLVLVVAIAALFPPSIYLVMAAIGFVSWPFVARLVRAEFLRLRAQEFVEAAIALGASDVRVIFRHILPNALAPVIVAATFGVAGAILIESALSFLGIGVPLDAPTWGSLLHIGRAFPHVKWWVSLFPGLAILVTIASYNLFAEALRDALDPRTTPWQTDTRTK